MLTSNLIRLCHMRAVILMKWLVYEAALVRYPSHSFELINRWNMQIEYSMKEMLWLLNAKILCGL